MVKKGTVVLLRDAIANNKDYIGVCQNEDISIICVSRETKNNKNMPFRIMYENNPKFWLQNEAWEYFISNEDFSRVQGIASRAKSQWEPDTVKQETESADLGFGRDYKSIADMTDAERIQHLKEDKNRLDSLIAQEPRKKQLVTEALVETAQDTILHNHAALANAMDLPDSEAKKQTQDLVDSTNDIVKSSTQLISASIFNDDLMNTLVAKSNGTTIQHMTRVFLNGVAFLSYYNNLVSTSSMINKLRISMDKNHRAFYQSLLPHTHKDFINLEKVFFGGMRAITENDFHNWSTGFLIHDIGKASAVEYHEGAAAYNRDIVIEHVKVGYTSVMNKTNYPREAGLIAGYHHEYYGDQSGYGYFRSYLDEYKKANPLAKQDFCITFELAPIMDFKALAYFPVKILEIIDVFDSVTDPNRKYHKAMTPKEALDMMRDEFIKKHKKIDSLLFEIFSKFVQEKTAA
jgi:HD-GYP domain-containing protein (c-di-GMP phosphodiesterase class II)